MIHLGSNLEKILNTALEHKRKRILNSLGLERKAKRPDITYESFKLSALEALRKRAKEKFKKSVKLYKKYTFPTNLSRKIKISRLESNLGKLYRESNVTRIIYIFWGYMGNKKICIYVGKTKGHGHRAIEHPRFFYKYKVTMVKLFRVKKGKKYLDASECYGMHAYAPSGKRYPPENKKRAENQKKTGYHGCRICKYIRKSWKKVQPLMNTK